jgi:hypothetical protein
MINVKDLMKSELARKTELLEENHPQSDIFHHKSHMILPGFDPGPLRVAASLLSYGTTIKFYINRNLDYYFLV